METAAQNFLCCPQALRRLGLSQLLEIGCEVEGAQEVEGGAVQKGDRCVSQLTTLLHRIEGEIVALQSLFATAEQHRYAAQVIYGGSI